MFNKKININLIILFFMFNSSLTTAQNLKKNNKSTPHQQLIITSNKVKMIRDKNQIIFTENVKAINNNNFTLYANEMIVKYKNLKDNKVEIVNIKTKENVKFINEKVVATGNEGLYDLSTNIITLKNNIKATEKGITVIADEFQYNVLNGSTNIIGNKEQNERVTIILDNIEHINKN